ncbi:GSCOCG00010334001-RA-CDS [Cotesia congregata]|uniref:Protein amnionless n=1 Tax=Cotesia congregata TaxID=51543 RepID=A0A8J2H543_COTCN|nr:GSCOCG00010334001-RA-CDS [Cotesia congregata]CAG5074838.1 Similar to Amn: Protein amnionless (Mus musculus) [Cotesia congregata]
MKLFILYLIITVNLMSKSECWRVGENKYWLPELEWSKGDNWINGIKPESNSRVVFPLEIYHSVGLPGNSHLQLSEIELSRDGSLLLSRDGTLQMSDSNNNSRDKEKSFVWKLKGPFYWVDPQNWGDSNKAVPDFERIPCSMDTVIFPNKNHALSITLPNTNVKVKQIKIGQEQTIDEWRWHSMMTGREFRNSPLTISYSGLQYCESDCICKPENSKELLAEICKIQAPRCGQLQCEFPLQIQDHCCDYCGGRVSVPSETITVSKLGEIAEEEFKNNKEIYWHARFAPDRPELEILIAERGIYSGIKSQEAIDKLLRRLMAKGIPIVEATSTGAPLTGSVLGNTLGPMFGIPIIILLIILLGLPYFGYSYTHIVSVWRDAYGTVREGIPFYSDDGFARFENLPEGHVQLSGQSTLDDLSDNSGSISGGQNEGEGKRFENPLYRSTRKSPAEQETLSDNNQESSEQSIINIDLPVSLTQLKKKVYSSEDTHIDSD